MSNKKAFTFVEIIVVISIIALLAVVWLSMQWASKQKTQNARAVWDIKTLNNSFQSYLTENTTLPNPKWNINYFGSWSEYVHVDAWSEDDTSISFWKHWFVTENILPKKYLNYLPLDPRTSQYYAYWKTTDSQFFEIAWVLKIDWTNTSSVSWNYPWEDWPYNLIKEYNWPDFVSNNSKTSFPYNPDEKILVAKINNYTWNVSITWKNSSYLIGWTQIINHTLVEWDTITVPANGQATLYYSDGSQSTLWDSTRETVLNLTNMEFTEENNLVTKVQLALESWTIWTKATSLNTDSDFEIYTQDTSASIRWTIFWMSVNNSQKSFIDVKEWIVEVQRVPAWTNVVDSIDAWEITTILTDLPISWVTVIESGKNVIKWWNSWNTTDNSAWWVSLVEPESNTFNTNFQTQISELQIDKEDITEIKFTNIPKSINANVLNIWSNYYYTEIINTDLYKIENDTQFQEINPNNNQEINNWLYFSEIELSWENNFSNIIASSWTQNIINYLCVKNDTAIKCAWRKTIQLVDWKANYIAAEEKSELIAQVSVEQVKVLDQVVIPDVPVVITANCPVWTAYDWYELETVLVHWASITSFIPEDWEWHEYWDSSNITSSKITTGEIKCNNGSLESIIAITSANQCNVWYSEFNMWWDIYCERTSDWTSSGKELYAFAPFDTAWDIKLYKNKTWTSESFTTSSSNILSNTLIFSSFCDSNYNLSKSFCTKSSKSWVFIDNNGTNDHIKYTGINFPDKFSIEMSVYIPNSNPGWTRYLFQLGDFKWYFQNDWKLRIRNGSGSSKRYDSDVSYNGTFQKIIITREDWPGANYVYSIFINWIKQWDFTSSTSIWSDLYIWRSESASSNQINSIIDYVKIYQ